jgi:ABC-type multidrug transport system fused ATPase/permease subunit
VVNLFAVVAGMPNPICVFSLPHKRPLSSPPFTNAQHLHDRLINSVMNAPTGWFDATPVGRIVNRFSQDMSTVVSYFTP